MSPDLGRRAETGRHGAMHGGVVALGIRSLTSKEEGIGKRRRKQALRLLGSSGRDVTVGAAGKGIGLPIVNISSL